MNKLCTLFIIVFFHFNSHSQSKSIQFLELSSPEKWWVIMHPFKAKKALIISQDALMVTDSISKTNQIVNDINGGQSDAFKHSYWMARLAQNIGAKSSLKLGLAHEKGNYKTFKKNRLEDGYLPDKISSDMDNYNNRIGIQITEKNESLSKHELMEEVIFNIQLGKMKVIKKDEQGNFLNCHGKIIPLKSLEGKWENDKCLTNSSS